MKIFQFCGTQCKFSNKRKFYVGLLTFYCCNTSNNDTSSEKYAVSIYILWKCTEEKQRY